MRSWAYDGQEEAPAQDWDLILSTISYEDLFIELASDIDCPKSVFFLSLLYFIVGVAVSS